MTLEEIKQAVRDGKTVCCDSPAYQVQRHDLADGKEQWLIRYIHSDYCIGLTHADGKTLNGKVFYELNPAAT